MKNLLFNVLCDGGQRGNTQIVCGGFKTILEAYDWASLNGYTNRIGFTIEPNSPIKGFNWIEEFDKPTEKIYRLGKKRVGRVVEGNFMFPLSLKEKKGVLNERSI